MTGQPGSEASARLAGRRLNLDLADGRVALFRFGRVGAPPLLFSHANGFCASAYRQMLTALGDAYDIFAVDLRGHGRTALPANPAHHKDMEVYGADLIRIKMEISNRHAISGEWVLAGHSMGGVAATIAAAALSDVAALRLIEPVAAPRRFRFLSQTPVWPLLARRFPLVRAASSRRAAWPDRESVLARYRDRPLFKKWAEGVLEDYLDDGLRPTGSGVALACDPKWEAANFMAFGHDFWGAFAKVKAPIAVLGADHASTTLIGSAAARMRAQGASVRVVPGVTHLIPFENPQMAAQFLATREV
jgi:pimeloyl-ACP methyl ester carboxylesterase